MPSDVEVAQVAYEAYEAYGDEAEWKNYLGKPMPVWADLPENTRSYWVASVRAILNLVSEQEPDSE